MAENETRAVPLLRSAAIFQTAGDFNTIYTYLKTPLVQQVYLHLQFPWANFIKAIASEILFCPYWTLMYLIKRTIY